MASITATVTLEVTRTITTSSSTSTSTNRAAPQGGVFEGLNPSHYDPKNPIILFIIQATIVIAFTRILHWPLSKLRQPRVIAEVITGILLGHSVMGRIPGFTAAIFPKDSMPAFTLAANIGLVLFLFLVGLEVDLRFLMSNWKIALSVGAAGMAIPFGLGFGIAYGLYHEFREDAGLKPISFGIYALFIGVALSITAFPVLCRILTSLKLLTTPVGIIVLSAGVGNDVVGWILLALCVALVNSGVGLTALWIFLVAVGYCFFLGYVIRPAFIWILKRTRSLENGPTQGVVALTLLLVFASAFFTGIIGIHPIFGAFVIGLICPHEGGFAIKLTEKIEDLVSTLFLPLYFALSGLSTDLGLLDSGITWAYVVAVTAIAFIGKIAGGTIASRLNGLVWRESFTIGCLMSCKGLVELIVLNIGLSANILSTRTFTIFVVMALVTTFATTPLTVWLYPPWYQQKLDLWKKGKIDWDGNPIMSLDGADDQASNSSTDAVNRLLVYLRADGLSSLFSIISLFTGTRSSKPSTQLSSESKHGSVSDDKKVGINNATISEHSCDPLYPLARPLKINGLRLMELTERNSSVMKVSEIEDYAIRDPVIKAFGTSTFNTERDVSVTGQIAVVPDNSFASTLVQRAGDYNSDFLLLPWSETGSVSEVQSFFDSATGAASHDPLASKEFANLVADVFEKASAVCNVGVFVDKTLLKQGLSETTGPDSISPVMERTMRSLSRTTTGISLSDLHDRNGVVFKSSDNCGRHQVRVIYQGGRDDLYAAKVAIQLVSTDAIDVRIVNVLRKEGNKDDKTDGELVALMSSLPVAIKDRVQVEQVEPASDKISSILGTLNLHDTREKGNATVIVGRGMIGSISSELSRSTSSTDRNRPLGSVADGLVAHAKAASIALSILVVQARLPDESERRRKDSTYSLEIT